MKDELSTKAGVFETGDKDVSGVAYKGNRLLSCRNNKLTEYTVADGTEIICDRAFYDCKAIERIVLPPSVKAIGEAAFSGCRNLREINIPEGVTVIKQGTFRDCESLAELTLPESIVALDKFSLGNGLTSLTCLAPEMDINKSAFGYCNQLATVYTPEGATLKYKNDLKQCGCNADVQPIAEKESFDLLSSLIHDKDDDCPEEEYQAEEPESEMKTIIISLRDKTEDGFDEDGEYTGEEKFPIRTLTFSSSSEDFYEIMDNEVDQVFGLVVPDDPEHLSYQIYDEDWSDEESVYCNFGETDDVDEIDYSADNLMMHKDMVSDEVVNQYTEEGEQIHGVALENCKGSVEIEIEIPADEEFDPTQAVIATRSFTYPDGESEEVISGIVYMGKFYRLTSFTKLDSEEPRIWDLN